MGNENIDLSYIHNRTKELLDSLKQYIGEPSVVEVQKKLQEAMREVAFNEKGVTKPTPQVDGPYIITEKVEVEHRYNPDYGDDRMCKCGDPYYRHFDTYDDMYPCGCKYCDCYEFVELKEGEESKRITSPAYDAFVAKVDAENGCWMVFSTAIGTNPCILVEHSKTGVRGTISEFSEKEWAKAYNAPSAPYKWEAGEMRINVDVSVVAEKLLVAKELKDADIPAVGTERFNELFAIMKQHVHIDAESLLYNTQVIDGLSSESFCEVHNAVTTQFADYAVEEEEDCPFPKIHIDYEGVRFVTLSGQGTAIWTELIKKDNPDGKSENPHG